jgi:DNA-binding GntR family transcriptional regulator
MRNYKYRQILEQLQNDIASGRYKPGKRLPSETELVSALGRRG